MAKSYISKVKNLLLLAGVVLILCTQTTAQSGQPKNINLQSLNPLSDGTTDDTRAFKELFKMAGQADGGTITIPPGN